MGGKGKTVRGEDLISLDRIKACSNPQCRVVLPADPENPIAAGFYVRERKDRRVVYFNSQCKDCINASKRGGKPRSRRAPEIRLVEHEGRLVQLRRCVNADCAREGLCLDGPDSAFAVNGRDAQGSPTQWRALCRDCHAQYQREQRRDPKKGERLKARRRQRHVERFASDPAYVERLRAEGRRRYAENPERRAQVAAAGRRSALRRSRSPRSAEQRETARMNYALRQEQAGRVVRHHRTVIDGTSPRIHADPFREWLGRYRSARGGLDNCALARELEMSERRVRSVLGGEYEKVALCVVDRALLNARTVVRIAGRDVVTLDDLYGEEINAKKIRRKAKSHGNQ